MSDEQSQNLKELRVKRKLKQFIERASALGIDNIAGLCELIPDQELQEALLKASEVHPLRGRTLSVEDLISEMQSELEGDEVEEVRWEQV